LASGQSVAGVVVVESTRIFGGYHSIQPSLYFAASEDAFDFNPRRQFVEHALRLPIA
jgi:hypothetical protein